MTAPARAYEQDEPAECQSEKSLLGALMVVGHLHDVSPELRPEDFGNVQHQAIYRLMLRLEEDEMGTDTSTVYDNMPPDLTSLTYLASPLDRIPRPDEEGIKDYVRCIRAAALRRRMQQWGA